MKQKGFTLIEIMIVMFIMAITLSYVAFTIPEKDQTKNEIEDLVYKLNILTEYNINTKSSITIQINERSILLPKSVLLTELGLSQNIELNNFSLKPQILSLPTSFYGKEDKIEFKDSRYILKDAYGKWRFHE